MTLLQFSNSFFALLIYPIVLPTIGPENYGLYVLYNSIVAFLLIFVNFGFDLLALKKISLNTDNKTIKQQVFFEIFWAKLYLILFLFILVHPILYFLDNYFLHPYLFYVVFLQIFGAIIPTWYYQAMSNMKSFTLIQVSIKALTLASIIIFIKSKNDDIIFAFIISLSIILMGVIGFISVIIKEKFAFSHYSLAKLKYTYKEASPFFINNLVIGIKDNGIVWYMGVFFGLRELAIYDLAQKVVSPLRTLLISVNTALFPKLVKNPTWEKIRKLLIIEGLIGLLAVVLISLYGWWAVSFLSQGELNEAYLMAILLAFTIPLWLIAGCFINFVFVSQSVYHVLAKSQICALATMWLLIIMLSPLYSGIFLIPLVIVLCGMVELLYYYIHTKKIFNGDNQ